MYNTFINQNANAFNLNLNDNFNNQSQSQILNFNKQKFNNIMSNGKYNNNNHDFDYNNNNFNVYNYNNNFNNNNFNNNYNFNNNNNLNNNNNANMMNMNMNMYDFLNTTWNMFQIYNSQENKNFSTMRFVKKDSLDIDSEELRKVPKTIIDIKPNYQGIKINIFFQDSRGTKVNVLSPFDISVKELLLNYVKKMGLGENVIDSGIYFLFNGGKLKKDEKKSIYELGILNGTIIIVIDRNAVMGA